MIRDDRSEWGFTLYLRWIKDLLEKGEGDEGGKNILDKEDRRIVFIDDER